LKKQQSGWFNKNNNEDILKKHRKEQAIAVSQGRDEKNNLDRILNSISSHQQLAFEKRKMIEELNFKNIDNNYELIMEVTKSDIRKDYKLPDPIYLFQLGQVPFFDKEKLAKVKARSTLSIPNSYKSFKY